ncbi:MAG: hypothetical protein R3331_09150 [Sulfurospirillaceae bacterium]|nr:hypothetical protein [Sulfurospirillaceae bacterium]
MKHNNFGVLILGLFSFMILTQEAAALPMFTTQTGIDCKGCHLQALPKLNKFGREFLISGMTLSKTIADLNSRAMPLDHSTTKLNCTNCHLPQIPKLNQKGKELVSATASQQKTLASNFSDMNINASLMFKSRYEKTWDKPGGSGIVANTDTADGELSIPRTVSVFLGGRINEHFSTLFNFSYKKINKGSISGKVAYSKKTDDGYFGSVLYSASNFGPFSGIELYNTGLYKPLRSFDIRTYSNALQMTNIGTGAATGLQVYYAKNAVFNDVDNIFVTVGFYAPGQDNLYMDLIDNLLPIARVAYEYPFGDFNVMFGAFGISGEGTSSSIDSLKVKRQTYGLDLQVNGAILEKQVQFTASRVFKNEVTFTGANAGLISDLDNRLNKAFSIEGTVDLTSNLGAKIAYLTYDDLYNYPGHKKNIDVKDIKGAVTIGLDYSFKFYTPMQVGIEYSWITPGLDRVKDYRNFVVTFNILL